MGMAGKIPADIVLMIEFFPWNQIRIAIGSSSIPDRMMVYCKDLTYYPPEAAEARVPDPLKGSVKYGDHHNRWNSDPASSRR